MYRKIRDWACRYPALGVLIGTNVCVWLIGRVLLVAELLSGSDLPAIWMRRYMELPADFHGWRVAPWTLVTYMFVHLDGLHLLFNMLWLLFFGILLRHAVSWRGIMASYLCGGVAGGVCYMASGGVSGHLVGASAAVAAVIASAAVLIPSRKVMLPLFGPVNLVWIAVIVVGVDVVAVTVGDAGGNWAHAGGAVAGAALGLLWRWLRYRCRPQLAVRSENTPDVDEILLKIRRSGHKSLTAEERRVLFKVSKGGPI